MPQDSNVARSCGQYSAGRLEYGAPSTFPQLGYQLLGGSKKLSRSLSQLLLLTKRQKHFGAL
jgi:hypothetical protein